MPYCIKPMLYDRLQRASLAVGVLLHDYYCCNLPVCVAFSVQFTTSGMCARNNTHIYVARTNSNRVISFVISIFACCHSVKLCALPARDFRSQQSGAVPRMWTSWQVQPSQKERTIGEVRCKKEGMLLQSLHWRCVECAIHHKRDVCEEQHPYMWREQTIIEWSWHVIFADTNMWTMEHND